MKKISKKILSFVLSFVMILTMGMSGVVTESAKAADSATTVDGHFGFELISGTNKSITVKTSLPTNTPCNDFLATDNGSKIDETSNNVANIGHVVMRTAEDSVIVFDLNLNATFTSGQQYKLPAKALFGFTDGKKYYLDADYTFTWDGSAWSMEKTNEAFITVDGTEKEVVARNKLEAGYTASSLVQFGKFYDFGLTASDTPIQFVGTVLLDGVRIESLEFVGYPETDTICLKNVGHEGKVLTIMKDSIIYYGDKAVIIAETFNQRSTGTRQPDGSISYTWESVADIPAERDTSFTMTYRWSNATTLQFNTTLPVSAHPANNNVELRMTSDTNVTQQPTATLLDADGTLVLTLTFNENFANGQCYTLSKGTKLVGADATYELQQDHICWWDGSAWKAYCSDDNGATIRVAGVDYKVAGKVALNEDRHIAYQTSSLVQIGNFANLEVPADGTQLSFSGTVFINGLEAKNFTLYGYRGDGAKTIAFTNLPHANKVLTIMAGSVIYYKDKAAVVEKAFHAKYDSKTNTWTNAQWTEDGNTPIISGDANVNCKVDSRDLVCLKKAQKNNVTVTPSLDITGDNQLTDIDFRCMRRILVGDAEWATLIEQTKEYKLAESNFNGGGEFITFADRPADPTDLEKIKEYKAVGFNTSLVTGEYGNYSDSYATGASGEKTYTLQPGEQSLELTVKYTSGSLFQVATNLPADGTYGNFSPTEKSEFEYVAHAGTLWYFQFGNTDGTVYLNPIYTNTVLKDGESFTYKAGSKFQVGDTWYALEADYTVTFRNDYQAGVKNLDAEGLNVWIRNTGNNPDYFTESRLALLQPYKDIIDGVYMNDEPFETEALYTYSKEKFNASEVTESFDTLGGTSATLFNENFANKYFHVNHVPITSYNHYGESQNLSAYDATKYNTFFNNYVNNVLSKVTTSDEKKTIGFDNYPFGYSSTNKILWWTSEKFNTTGIEPTYLLNLLIPAQVAKKEGNTYSVCIQTYDKIIQNNETRAVDTKEEITMQIYSAMACGADMLEYFLYNTLPASANSTAMPGMIAEDGSKRPVYTATMNANKEALPFADVVKTFTWEGAEFFSGTSNKNSDGKNLVNNSSLNLVLSNSNDGVLNSASATDDVLVGYYTKDGQDAYMLANFNDPKQVTNSNSVTLNFGDCNYARVYTGTADGLTSEIVSLNNGSYTFTLQPGGGCFVIPVNAAS